MTGLICHARTDQHMHRRSQSSSFFGATEKNFKGTGKPTLGRISNTLFTEGAIFLFLLSSSLFRRNAKLFGHICLSENVISCSISSP